LQILTEILDPGFSPFSFGFRPNRKAYDSIRKAKQYIEEGYRLYLQAGVMVNGVKVQSKEGTP